MTRSARHNAPGAVYHLISRFVDREWFITNESERSQYLSLLGRALSLTDWRCFSYAIMSNHIHLGVIAGTDPLGSWMRRVHSPFADWMNRSHDRIGVMFVRGPKDVLVPPPRVGVLVAYIHNNPVRARVVSDPSDTSWTSHRAYVGLARPPKWLHVEEGLRLAGAGVPSTFDAFVRSNPELPHDDDAGYEPETELRKALEPSIGVDPAELVRTAASVFGLSIEELQSRRKQEKHVRARQVAVRCGDQLGLTGVELAKALNASQQCVSRILTRPDDARNRAAVGRILQRLDPELLSKVEK